MMKKQSDGAWLLSAPGIWESVPTFYCRACGAFLHSSIQRFFPASCNGNLTSCNGNLYRAMERFTSCNGNPHIVQWKVGLHKFTTSIYVTPSEPGHMDNPIL